MDNRDVYDCECCGQHFYGCKEETYCPSCAPIMEEHEKKNSQRNKLKEKFKKMVQARREKQYDNFCERTKEYTMMLMHEFTA